MLRNRIFTRTNVSRIAAALSVALLLFVGVLAPRAGWAKPMDQSQTDMSHLASLQGQEFEIHWLSMMIQHHQGAVEMAKLAETRAKHAEIKTISQNIIRDQNREIGDMTNWLKQWYNKDPMMGMMHESMHGGMSGMDMSALEKLTGDAFDKAFLIMMHEHHRGAIAMAEMLPTRATHTDLKTLGLNIITSQEAEIQQFMQWAMTWYNVDLMSPTSGSSGGAMSPAPMGGMSGMGGTQPGMPRTGSPLLPVDTTLLVLLAGIIVGAGLALSRKGRATGKL